jgi:hypothetical protein
MEWQYFPRSRALPPHLRDLVEALRPAFAHLPASENHVESDQVLRLLTPALEGLGYEVESGKLASQKVRRPVLFGANGVPAKTFDVDAFHAPTGTVLEVEAGRGVRNHQFLKDLFEACAIQDAEYLVLAVLLGYWPKSFSSPAKDFLEVTNFIDTLYASERMSLPLRGILIIGYDGKVSRPKTTKVM